MTMQDADDKTSRIEAAKEMKPVANITILRIEALINHARTQCPHHKVNMRNGDIRHLVILLIQFHSPAQTNRQLFYEVVIIVIAHVSSLATPCEL